MANFKKSEIEKKIKKYNMIESANKIKLTTQKRQACVSLLIWEAFPAPLGLKHRY